MLKQISTSNEEVKPHISIVTPVYLADNCIVELVERVNKSVSQITENYEIILVDDASPDHSWDIISEVAASDEHVKGFQLSRNFGQHYAISAGIDHAQGEWIVVMDCDLQDNPEAILALYEEAKKGFEVVFVRRLNRKDTFIKSFKSRMFYQFYNFMTDSDFDYRVGNFSIISSKVASYYRQMKEQNRSYHLFIKWLGFNCSFVDFEHGCRFDGETSYTLAKLLRFAFDCIISQSNKPLIISVYAGFLISFLSGGMGIYFISRYYTVGVPIQGWTSLIVTLFFLLGIMMTQIGVLGLYIGKIFNETKARPLYAIRQQTDDLPTTSRVNTSMEKTE